MFTERSTEPLLDGVLGTDSELHDEGYIEEAHQSGKLENNNYKYSQNGRFAPFCS